MQKTYKNLKHQWTQYSYTANVPRCLHLKSQILKINKIQIFNISTFKIQALDSRATRSQRNVQKHAQNVPSETIFCLRSCTGHFAFKMWFRGGAGNIAETCSKCAFRDDFLHPRLHRPFRLQNRIPRGELGTLQKPVPNVTFETIFGIRGCTGHGQAMGHRLSAHGQGQVPGVDGDGGLDVNKVIIKS